MKICIIFVVLLAMLIGTGLAENVKTGDVKAFQKALEKDGFTVQKGGLGYFDAKQMQRNHCILSIPQELAKKLTEVDHFSVTFDNGRLVYSPIKVAD